MNYWIVASKHSRDDSTKGWGSKWTVDSFIRDSKFYPSKRENDFKKDDLCILRVFGSQDLIANFGINSNSTKDDQKHIYYEIADIEEWDFPVNQHLLPPKYTNLMTRTPCTVISEKIYYELLGIRNISQNLKINYKNILKLPVSEKDIETLIDTKNALRSNGLEIIDRQLSITPGNIIDLLCKDSKGDLVVVELKKHSPNETIGQLARYVTDIKQYKAKPSQNVSGMILALEVDEQLIKAARGVGFEIILCQIVLK